LPAPPDIKAYRGSPQHPRGVALQARAARKRVAAERAAGKDADVIVASLGPKIRAEYADWTAPEWIDFAIRYYSTLS
jgi:hypothetical protein